MAGNGQDHGLVGASPRAHGPRPDPFLESRDERRRGRRAASSMRS